jgi:hypothetical protein
LWTVKFSVFVSRFFFFVCVDTADTTGVWTASTESSNEHVTVLVKRQLPMSPLRLLLHETLATPGLASLLPDLIDVVFEYMPFVLPMPLSGQPMTGLLHWLGTSRGTASWLNPALAPSPSVWVSSKHGRNAEYLATQIVDAPTAHGFFMLNMRDSSVAFDFGDVQIHPLAYTIQHHRGTGSLRSWQLEGSQDQIRWTVLRPQVCNSLRAVGRTNWVDETWPIEKSSSPSSDDSYCEKTVPSAGQDVYYRYIRLRQTAQNPTGVPHLFCHAFELYGAVLV